MPVLRDRLPAGRRRLNAHVPPRPGEHAAPWLLAEPKIGMQVQVRALARLLGLEAEERVLERRSHWARLPFGFVPCARLLAHHGLGPPWPPLTLSCGRYAALVAAAIGRVARPAPASVHIQDPRLDPRLYTVIVAPEHDAIEAPNVVRSAGSIHGYTAEVLAAAAAVWAPRLPGWRPPRVAALVGGSSPHHRFGPAEAAALGRALATAVRSGGATLAVAASRRTAPDAVAALAGALDGSACLFWSGEGENPYPGLLALADHLVVTADSVNMVTEACATGRPVYVQALPGGSARFDDFHARLREAGRTRPFLGRLDGTPSPAPLDPACVAGEVWRRLDSAGFRRPHGAP